MFPGLIFQDISISPPTVYVTENGKLGLFVVQIQFSGNTSGVLFSRKIVRQMIQTQFTLVFVLLEAPWGQIRGLRPNRESYRRPNAENLRL